MLRFTTVCFACCLASGCFSTPAIYPDQWAKPQISEGRDCPSIDGSYVNSGEIGRGDESVAYGVGEARSLAHIFNGGTGVDSLELWNKLGNSFADPALDPNVTVKLSLADAHLHVTAAHADGSSRSISLPVSSACRSGLLVIDSDWDSDFEVIGPPAPEFSRKSIALGRASDGSLLVRENKSAVLFFLFTPAFGYREAAWIRFEEVPTVAAAVAEISP